ncbi:IS110 family transposase [Paenibacillus sabuli]|uniref:IS110 family transposase n=1 Tax=Paenibacillus sabuli TaxID=2772509 RepID=UPI001CC2B3D1|nr:IS110 family transposase [Paenibacillus sabuli]
MKRAAGALGQAKAEQLLQCAAQSVGKRGTESEAQRDLKRLVDQYDSTTQVLQEVMEEVEALFGDLPLVEQLRSIQGLGSVAIASLFSYAGDLRHYAHGDQLLCRAGLNLAERTSGRYKGQIKLSKRGDSTLRKHLFLAVLSLVRQHPDFKRWHAHHVARGMTDPEAGGQALSYPGRDGAARGGLPKSGDRRRRLIHGRRRVVASQTNHPA